MYKGRQIIKRLKIVPRNCPFCKSKTKPDFKEPEILKNYLSERAKIIGKDRTGICSKHQRRLAQGIKRARFLGLLPFTVQVR
ncbi:30S ribosomal protein S18 [Candidatus Shapirobacteria bacterium CG03_land_8_20_14_0_80_39_12]|uniref:Small ribosomal subunit protein bS18 n=1 Tax=Candidatus Shapirobacteria bacterium CG03_land_8_20_14_0_80_39_12 TaxID=1974879 RepID=A0A2M7BCN2_9BACT|nr:MAG: 30S ribosomal protein S18 [Candidatus Shapirobacteria bacterium CG03_land_8_20_14_0_80_39_12]